MAKKNIHKEVSEIEQSYKSVAGKYAKKSSSGKGGVIAIIASSVVLVLIIAAFALLYFFPDILNPRKIESNVSVAGVNLSGMSRKEAISTVKDQLGSSYEENTLVITAGETTVELSPELTGAKLDAEALVDAILDADTDTENFDIIPYLNLNEEAIRNSLNTIVEANETELVLTSYEVTGSYDLSAETTDMKLVVQTGHPGINANVDLLYEAVLEAYRSNEFQVEYDLRVVDPEIPDLDAILEEHGVTPVDAVMDMETFKVTPHVVGVGFDTTEAKALLTDAQFDSTVEIPFQILQPENTTDSVSSVLFRDELGSYTARSSSHPGGRDVNLDLSCKKINGTILYPGDLFDYNKALGERTAAGGWQKADGYANGDTVSVYGGGICQASSALYYCTLIADLEVVTRFNHSYVSSYMPLGMDATVSWGGPDFRFRNNTEYPIKIVAYASGGTTTVKIMGTDTKDYYVEMEYAVLSRTPFETVYEEMTQEEAGDRKDGQQLVSGYTGHKVVTYKCKYNKETKELISREEEVVSTYKKRDRVLVKIVEATDPTQPSDPTDPTTPSTDPTTPTEPSTPTEPTNPVEPTEPVLPPTEETIPTPGSGGNITEG